MKISCAAIVFALASKGEFPACDVVFQVLG
jgi:hypothetical protein